MARKAAIPTAVAVLAFIAALAFAYFGGEEDGGSRAVEPTPTVAAARTSDSPTAEASTPDRQATADATADEIDGTAAGSSADAAGTSTPSPSPSGTTAPPTVQPQAAAPPPPTPTALQSPVAGYRLRVPSLGVSATMTDLGVDDAGVMEVPLEAQLVGWYRFTSLPGQPGNVLLGGHITWHGATAVFRYLESMSPGDTIYIDTPDGQTLQYVVQEAWWAQPYSITDVRRVIGTRSGPETVTLFTCGGTWDSADREYSHRRVVTAVRVA